MTDELSVLFPVGAMVRDVKYDLLGTVVQPRKDGTVRASFPSQVGAHVEHTASFPDPVGRLERVHLLTHDELSVLDDAVPVSDRSYDKRANEILVKHLRPTVNRTFTVTIKVPADRNADLTHGHVRLALINHDSAINPNEGITVVETTEETN